jgi:hypothetical protein
MDFIHAILPGIKTYSKPTLLADFFVVLFARLLYYEMKSGSYTLNEDVIVDSQVGNPGMLPH